jgi:hypothetical protein
LAKLPTRGKLQEARVIRRPEDLEEVRFNLVFNLKIYDQIEIDLAHINKDSRSVFSAIDIGEIVCLALNGVALKPTALKIYANGSCEYFVRRLICKGKKFRLVFCVCDDKPTTLGVITIFRTRGDYESI